MTSTSPEFLPVGEDSSAAPSNTMHSCVYELCVCQCTWSLVWEQILVELGLHSEILTTRSRVWAIMHFGICMVSLQQHSNKQCDCMDTKTDCSPVCLSSSQSFSAPPQPIFYPKEDKPNSFSNTEGERGGRY